MKIKTDFVTNSSSTSFIIKNKNPFKVAKAMVNLFFNDWKYFLEDEEPMRQEHPYEKVVLEWFEENKDFEGNICIPWTSNYETYIYKDWFECVRIDTCRNTNWEEVDLEIDHYVSGYTDHDDDLLFLDLSDFQTRTRKECDEKHYKEMMGETEET